MRAVKPITKRLAPLLLAVLFLSTSLIGLSTHRSVAHADDENVYVACGLSVEPTSCGDLPGGGTQGSPYIISTCSELQVMSSDLAAYYALAHDIDCTAVSITSVGTSGSPFTGGLDGRGFLVDHLATTNGLFGDISSTAIITTIGLTNVSVSGSNYTGGLVGHSDGAIISSFVTGTVAGYDFTGGLVGHSEGSVQNSYARATVSGHNYVGGLIGNNNGGSVNNSYSAGSVTNSGTFGGGLVGYNGGGAYNTFWDTQTSGKASSEAGTGKTTSEMTSILTFTYTETDGLGSAWDFVGTPNDDSNTGEIWNIGAPNDGYPYLTWQDFSLDIPGPQVEFGAGDGSELSPYQITDCEMLQGINQHLTSYFVLNTNIDCSETTTWNSGAGFVPIGADGDYFQGELNGNGKVVTDLYINLPGTDRVGLFAEMALGSLVHDLGIEDADITGDDAVGILGGLVYGTVNDSYSTGVVSATAEVGGLVGGHNGWDTVRDSYSTADVSGGWNVGGLVGTNYGNIYDSYATGEVIGESNVGGLVGYSSGSSEDFLEVSGTHATGHVTGQQFVGGLIGGGNDMYVVDSYATGDVSGEESEGIFFGGLAGGLQFVYVDSNYATGDVTAAFANGVGGLLGFGVVYTGQSYATGAVVGYEDVGGFAGSLECSGAPVAESFSTGSVYGETSVGGFAGYVGAECGLIDNYTTSDVTAVGEGAGFVSELADARISSSYAAGSVSSGGEYGGFVAVYSEEDSMIESSFWDAEVNTNLDNSPAVGLPTEDMKTLSSYTDAEWNFEDVWAINTEYNNGYPCHQWTGFACGITPDEDSDGISDEEEALAPNAGDANNDGTQDSEQSNVASYYNFITESYSVLETDCNSISAIQLGRESSEMPDAAFEYPMGLLSFHIECEDIGDTATITQYYYGTTDNDSYSARKWLDDGSYQEIPGYTVESVTIDGEPVLKVSYQITDGGPLDDDGEANAVIVDPSGAAVLAAATSNGNSSDPLSNTGQTIVLIYGIALTLIAGLIGFKLATRQQKPAKK